MNQEALKPNDYRRVLLNLTANSLFGAERSVDTVDVNWSAVWLEAYMQTVPLIAFSDINEAQAHINGFDKIKEQLNGTLARNIQVNYEHTHIHSIMREEGIPYVILKGFAAALYYPDPLMRAMGDVDFLVLPGDIERAGAALEKNGFELVKENHDCHKVYTANGCRYEMHFEPSGIPSGEVGEKIRGYLAEAVKCGEEVETELGTMMIPSAFHHGLIIMLHLCHHLTGDGIGLRHLCDWAVFISNFTEDEYRRLFEEKFKETGLWYFTCAVNRLCIDYLGCPARMPRGEDNEELAEHILFDIFKGGNFGQKSSDRAHEQLLISAKTQGGMQDTSMIKQFFVSLNSIVYSHWKISRKLKLILPFGWLFFSLRYFMRSLSGNRPKIRPKKVADEAAQRKKLYIQLRLFEPEK